MIDTLSALFQPWADFFAASATVPTVIIAVHVLAMFAGGGIAIAADRRVLYATPGSSEAFLAVAEDLRSTHSVVIGALMVMVTSGVALVTSDFATFAASPVYWSKMGTFVALIANGARLRHTETRMLTNARNTIELSVAGPEVTGPWKSLRMGAWVSLILWCAVVLQGVIVGNV